MSIFYLQFKISRKSYAIKCFAVARKFMISLTLYTNFYFSSFEKIDQLPEGSLKDHIYIVKIFFSLTFLKCSKNYIL